MDWPGGAAAKLEGNHHGPGHKKRTMLDTAWWMVGPTEHRTTPGREPPGRLSSKGPEWATKGPEGGAVSGPFISDKGGATKGRSEGIDWLGVFFLRGHPVGRLERDSGPMRDSGWALKRILGGLLIKGPVLGGHWGSRHPIPRVRFFLRSGLGWAPPGQTTKASFGAKPKKRGGLLSFVSDSRGNNSIRYTADKVSGKKRSKF